MDRIEIKSLFADNFVGQDVTVCGWVRSIRRKKKFSFGIINDSSCQKNLQIIMDADIPGYDAVSSLLAGASLRIKGKVVSSGGQGQDIEIQAIEGEVLV